MYRHSGQISIAKNFLPSPASDELTDFEADIVEELNKKRQQLDEEISKFKAQKEKEFRDFEKDLRFKRKRSKSPNTKDNLPKSSNHSALSLLAAASKLHVNGSPQTSKRISEGLVSPKTKPVVPPSKATLSLDKLNINGTTTPPVFGTPPSNAKALARSSQIALTPPRSRSLTKSSPPPSTQDRNDSFVGLFAPAYLPLLEAHPNNKQQEEVKSGKSQSITPQSSSLPHDSPTLLNNSNAKRALTAPILPSTSLPSALRTASGTSMRKRKRVTFQLADRAVVEPSSSYEEMSSPDLPSEGIGEINKLDEIVARSADAAGDSGLNEASGSGVSLRNPPSATATTEILSLPSRPSLTRSHNSQGSIDSIGSASGGFGGVGLDNIPEAADGGSGVGFFELDEELGTPSPTITSSRTTTVTSTTRAEKGVGESIFEPERDPFDDEDEILQNESEQDDDIPDEKRSQSFEGDVEEHGVTQRGRKTRRRHLGDARRENKDDEEGELKYGSFSAGSVPIKIVRPSGSWVGSFGH